MAEEAFLLVSLQDEKAKRLSEVIGNKTAKKILELLAQGKHTESDIAKALNIPISTAHYNIQLLLSSGLVKAKEYHYSSKGKEVNHYELVNKLIIISPGNESEKANIGDILKRFIPITLGVGAISLVIEFFGRTSAKSASIVAEQADKAAAPMMARTLDSSVESLAAAAPAVAPSVNYSLWFLYGGLFVMLAMLILELIRRKRK